MRSRRAEVRGSALRSPRRTGAPWSRRFTAGLIIRTATPRLMRYGTFGDATMMPSRRTVVDGQLDGEGRIRIIAISLHKREQWTYQSLTIPGTPLHLLDAGGDLG